MANVAELDVRISSKGAKRGAGEVNRELDKMNNKAKRAFRGMNDEANKAGKGVSLLGSAMKKLGVVAGIVVAAAAFKDLALTAGRAESQFKQINALLNQTNFASGQTADSIERLSREIGIGTLASTQEVRTAATQLLTFTKVTGTAFDRTLRVAQDLASTGFGDLSSATKALGKALSDPERRLSELSRSGITFSQSQVDMIKAMAETGDQAGAMSEILTVIENQVGGAGAAAAEGTLLGAIDSLGEQWTLLKEAFRETKLFDVIVASIAGLADGVGLLRHEIERLLGILPLGETESQGSRNLNEARAEIRELQAREMELIEMRRRTQKALAANPDNRGLQIQTAAIDQSIQEIRGKLKPLYAEVRGQIGESAEAGFSLGAAAVETPLKDSVEAGAAAGMASGLEMGMLEFRKKQGLRDVGASGEPRIKRPNFDDFLRADAPDELGSIPSLPPLDRAQQERAEELKRSVEPAFKEADRQLSEVRRLFNQGLIDEATFRALHNEIANTGKALDDLPIEKTKDRFDAMAKASEGSARILSDAFGELVTTLSPDEILQGGQALDDFFLNLGRQISQLGTQIFVVEQLRMALESLVNVGGSGGGGGFSLFGGLSSLFSPSVGTIQNNGLPVGGFAAATGVANPLVGFADGGSFRVGGSGGTDSQLVSFMASPDETVTVTKPGQMGGSTTVNVGGISFQGGVQKDGGMTLQQMEANIGRRIQRAAQRIN
jgi:hypothetical protein